jgi:hypothetical protein
MRWSFSTTRLPRAPPGIDGPISLATLADAGQAGCNSILVLGSNFLAQIGRAARHGDCLPLSKASHGADGIFYGHPS